MAFSFFADVQLRNYSLTHSLMLTESSNLKCVMM